MFHSTVLIHKLYNKILDGACDEAIRKYISAYKCSLYQRKIKLLTKSMYNYFFLFFLIMTKI